MPRDADRADDLVYCLVSAAVAAGLPRDAASQLDREMRDAYGGKRVYVPRRAPVGTQVTRPRP